MRLVPEDEKRRSRSFVKDYHLVLDSESARCAALSFLMEVMVTIMTKFWQVYHVNCKLKDK